MLGPEPSPGPMVRATYKNTYELHMTNTWFYIFTLVFHSLIWCFSRLFQSCDIQPTGTPLITKSQQYPPTHLFSPSHCVENSQGVMAMECIRAPCIIAYQNLFDTAMFDFFRITVSKPSTTGISRETITRKMYIALHNIGKSHYADNPFIVRHHHDTQQIV